MNASKMDRRLTLLTYAPATGAMGGVAEGWTEGDTVWAERRDQPGRERLAAGQVNAAAGAIFFIRWRAGMASQDRVRCDGLEYDIVGLREIGRRDGIEITATARA